MKSLRYLFMRSALMLSLPVLGLMAIAQPAHAVPSFARQTGLACEACHTVFPELTPFGRLFKMKGYTLQNVKQLQDINEKKEHTLSLGDLPPISAMFVASSSFTQTGQPDSKINSSKAQNGTVGFPQQASIFYSGRIADNFGAYFQLTYNPTTNSIGIDNTDLRFADQGMVADQDLIYGVTLNNNPGAQDVWNNTPAWWYPYMNPMAVPTPQAQMLFSKLGQQTAGAGAYMFANKQWYAEMTAYRSAQIGVQQLPLDSTTGNVISGVAPYWRIAYNREWGPHSLEIGHWGMFAALHPGNGVAVVGTPTDNYTDLDLDAQYQYIGEDHIITVTASAIHEQQKLGASQSLGLASNGSDNLTRLGLVGSYYYHRKYGASLGLYNMSGTADPLLYTSANTGKPNSSWAVLEADYLPWLNTKLFLQYTAYSKFNGSNGQYDVAATSRSASDNNTLYAGLWFAF